MLCFKTETRDAAPPIEPTPALQPVTVLVGRPGAGKTVACLSITDEQRIICLPTRVAIIAMSRYATTLALTSTKTISCVFFEAGQDAGGAETATLTDVGWTQFLPQERRDALNSDIVFVTPYQMRIQRFRPNALYIVDEAHECAVDRLTAVAAVALRGDPLVLATATPPPWLNGQPTLFGRPLEYYELPGLPQKVRICQAWSNATKGGVTLTIHGSIRSAVQSAEKDKLKNRTTALLCGENDAAETETILQRIRSGEVGYVHATIGVCASSVSIARVTRIVVTKSALAARSYGPGQASAQSSVLTRLELEQVLGRCAREGARIGEACFMGSEAWEESGWVGSWHEALEKSKLATAPDLQQMRRQNFAAMLPILGTPTLESQVAIGVCQLLQTAPTLIAFLRACYQSLSTYVGGDFTSWSLKLGETQSQHLRWGGDLGRTEPQTAKQPAGFFSEHRALRDPGAQALEPTLELRVGLLLTLGPGANGAWTCAKIESQFNGYEPLLDTGPACADQIAADCLVDGRPMKGEFPQIGCVDIASRERALLSGCEGRKVPAGVPMGSRANGSVVNACTSCAALAARAAMVANDLDPIRIGTGGDDILSEHDPVKTEILAIMETSTQRKENDQKTHEVDWRTAYAVVLERYWRKDKETGAIKEFLPPPCLARVKNIVAFLNGGMPDLKDDRVSLACRWALHATAGEWAEHLASKLAETKLPKLKTGLFGPPQRGEQSVELSMTFSAVLAGPTFAGRDGGEHLGMVRKRLQDVEASVRKGTRAELAKAPVRAEAPPKVFRVRAPSGHFTSEELLLLKSDQVNDAARTVLSKKLRALAYDGSESDEDNEVIDEDEVAESDDGRISLAPSESDDDSCSAGAP